MRERSVANAKSPRHWHKGGVGLLFLCLQLNSWAREPDPLQTAFEEGVTHMLEGRQSQAMLIFEELHRQTGSPRVKLEWARSAFLNHDYDLAGKLFNEVLTLNPPPSVQFNIRLYLQEIWSRSDQTDYGLSLTRDTNPTASANRQEVRIFGIPFQYTPERAPATVTGLRVYLQHARTVDPQGRLRLSGHFERTNYEQPGVHRTGIKTALEIKPYRQSPWSGLAGLDAYWQPSQEILIPYLGIRNRRNGLAGFFQQIEIELKWGQHQLKGRPELRAYSTSSQVAASKSLLSNVQWVISGYADKVQAATPSASYQTQQVASSLKTFASSLNTEAQLTVAQLRRRFDGLDELFLVHRQDSKQWVSLSVSPRQFRIMNMYPVAEVTQERHRSNIAINAYQRSNLQLTLKKNF